MATGITPTVLTVTLTPVNGAGEVEGVVGRRHHHHQRLRCRLGLLGSVLALDRRRAALVDLQAVLVAIRLDSVALQVVLPAVQV